MRKLVAAVESVLDKILLLIFTVMVVAIVWQVFARYVLLRPTVWSEELARYLMVWTTMLGSALVVRRGGHVAVTVFVELLPARVQHAIGFFRDALTILMAGYLAYCGYGFALAGARRTSSGLGIPMTYPYAAIFIGGLFLALIVLFDRIIKEGEPE